MDFIAEVRHQLAVDVEYSADAEGGGIGGDHDSIAFVEVRVDRERAMEVPDFLL